MINPEYTPATGWQGLKENWRNDLIAAISVALVALPLGLGIAVASGVEPISGILSAIIGGIVGTLFRGSHLAINGPTAGLIAVILAGLAALEGNISYVLAAFVVAGALQVILGIVKAGRYAKMFPSSVLNGILAAIGVIIIIKQLHFALGTTSNSDGIIGTLKDAYYLLPETNPFVAIITFFGLLILIFYKKIPFRFIHLIPAPMWVLIVSLPFAIGFDFFSENTRMFMGKEFLLGPHLLIHVPDNLLDSIIFPDFAMIGTLPFWTTVISITLVASVESLASARAIDKLDPYKRVTNLDKDLMGVGLSTMVAGGLGGLPVISVILRSTVNVQNNAKTKWSNFYHAIILIAFVLVLSPLLQSIPLAALAAILLYTGFKLASPKVFYNTYDQGVEQLLFMTATLGITLLTNILVGIIGGILIALILHMLLAKVDISRFFQMIFKSGTRTYRQEDGSYDVKVKGVANFLSILKINKLLGKIPDGSKVRIDMSRTILVDLSVMENIIEYKRIQDNIGGNVTIVGLDHHWSSSGHNRALKIIVSGRKKKITRRQRELQKMAIENGWSFEREVDWNTSYLRNFIFFETRPIERKTNSIRGVDSKHDTKWEIADITFDEGALFALEVFHSTVLVIRLNQEIPRFIVEKEGIFDKIFDRVKAFSGFRERNLKLYPKISRKFLVVGEADGSIKKFFHKDLVKFLERNTIQHIESNGEALMVFKYLHYAPVDDMKTMLEFSQELVEQMGIGKK